MPRSSGREARSPGRRGDRDRDWRPARRLPAPVPGGGAGLSASPSGALRPRLRRWFHRSSPRGRPAKRRHRRDRPSLAEPVPRVRRHRGRDAAGARPLRVPRVAGRVRAACAPLTDVVTECERRFRRLPAFVQKGTFSPRTKQLRPAGELGRGAADLPERPVGRGRGQARHLELVPEGVQDPREARGPGRVPPFARA